MRETPLGVENRNKMANSELTDSGLTNEVGEENVHVNRVNFDEDFYKDLPDAVIVANVPESVFDNPNAKKEFEDLFNSFSDEATFIYLKSFRRARIQFPSPELAVNVKLQLHETEVLDNCIKCYLAQPVNRAENRDPHLQPPALEKQFLISPPASPPVGWEQMQESEPVINYDLIAAMAKLTPGEAHELHAQTADQPGIVVHICEDPVGVMIDKERKIPQTRCPERRT